ncbi:MAG: alpha/beta fold hydrolase [Acidobacteria bacterium]|nr:alpha/beta fold hydrolase [Acidobacteriota bacterium]
MSRSRLVALSLAALVTSSIWLRAAPQAPTPATPAAPPAAAQGRRGGGPVVSPEVGADRRVTFRLRLPSAQAVAVTLAGKRIEMAKNADGVWTATTDALEPDIYTYSFNVDGAALNDPANRQAQTSFGSFQSMFVVPGDKAWLPKPGAVRGAVTRQAFHSVVANDDRDFFVYTPPGYDARRKQPYPVLYLLHGLGDDAERWLAGGGGAANILDNLIADKRAVPMIVVSPLGYGTSTGPAGGRGSQNVLGYARILLDEVMPVVDRSYNVSTRREDRAIAGLSMGGAESLYVGLNNLDRFAWIGAFSSALLLLPPAASVPAPQPAAAPAAGRGAPTPLDPSVFDKAFPNLSAKDNARIRMLWITCGTADGLIGQNRQFREWLRGKGMKFSEEEVPDMAHVWPLWRQNVTDMVPKLFR